MMEDRSKLQPACPPPLAECLCAWAGGHSSPRRGVILVKVALLLPVLIGMLGLVIDVGILLASQRIAQNAADAAALAAAMDRLRGKSEADALATANQFVQTYNGLASAPALVWGTSFSIPPTAGAYAGDANFVEVTVTQPVDTLFIHILGIARHRTVSARAVAGFQPVAAGEGVMVLDPSPQNGVGLGTSGNAAHIWVNGRITVNAQDPTKAVTIGGQSQISALEMAVVGGVTGTVLSYGTTNPLTPLTAQLPEPDPLINLPTPTTSNGADATVRGRVKVTNTGPTFKGNPGGLNRQLTSSTVLYHLIDGTTVSGTAGQTVIYPGVYSDISIQAGNVIFIPGIYVIKPAGTSDGLNITGTGTVVSANGVMIYSTGSDFDAVTGSPDNMDGDQAVITSGTTFADVSINTSVKLSAIDTQIYDYSSIYTGAPDVSDAFDGMLFYQRRRNGKGFGIGGNAADGWLKGTLYARMSLATITGQGTYDAQFIVGSMSASGQGKVTILAAGPNRGRANEVFLVE